MKIAINRCYGGFDLAKDITVQFDHGWPKRDDPKLIQLIEELGSKRVSGPFGKIVIAEIPDDATDWRIEDYDGLETVLYVLDGEIYECEGYIY